MDKINEVLNKPYNYVWSGRGGNDWLARAKLDDGTNLSIDFSRAPDLTRWFISFERDGDMRATGQGDQFRIFATVVAATQDWWKQQVELNKERHPEERAREIIFTAESPGTDKEAIASRIRLYDRFARRFARSIGKIVARDDSKYEAIWHIKSPKLIKKK